MDNPVILLVGTKCDDTLAKEVNLEEAEVHASPSPCSEFFQKNLFGNYVFLLILLLRMWLPSPILETIHAASFVMKV